jgi:hypothetical protein
MTKTDSFSTIPSNALDAVTGGVHDGDGGGGNPPGPDGPGDGGSRAGDSLRKLASTEEGRRLLAEMLPPRNTEKKL